MPRIRANARAMLPPGSEDTGAGPSSSSSPLAAVSMQQGFQFEVLNSLNSLQQLLPFGNKLGPAAAAVTGAASLKKALGSGSSVQDWKSTVLDLVQLGGLVASGAGLVGAALSPQGPGAACDHNALERCANCATSVPYVLVGVHSLQNRKTKDGKVWGGSMCAVGMASAGFHASSGKWRTLGRRLDYWSIALSSNLMLRAVYPNLPPVITALGIAATPFKPFLVSSLNTGAMELKYLRRARKDPERLRKSQLIHAGSSLLGITVFALEEFFPKVPFIHSAWHSLSAVSVASINNLLDHVETVDLGLKD